MVVVRNVLVSTGHSMGWSHQMSGPCEAESLDPGAAFLNQCSHGGFCSPDVVLRDTIFLGFMAVGSGTGAKPSKNAWRQQ